MKKCDNKNRRSGRVEMDEEKYSLKEAIDLYFGEPRLTEEEEKQIDERLKKIEESGFLDKCKEVARQSEKKRIRIGRLCISKVACIVFIVCLSTALTGGIVYAAVLNHIRGIQVKDKGNHGELEIDYNDVSVTVEKQEKNPALEILDYYEPVWIPEGYYKETEHMHVMSYNTIYQSKEFDGEIYYSQDTSTVKTYYSTENGRSEQVSFREYSGEYIETDDSNYLIVTDGTYVYSLIAQPGNVGRQEMIKMIESIEK
ncbi:MAG: DUF4367 domain-containing protein [Lachnospiraceae bacterium]|nr:DUF4367 domain-containing protein [Lachnospiraceae bacterium]